MKNYFHTLFQTFFKYNMDKSKMHNIYTFSYTVCLYIVFLTINSISYNKDRYIQNPVPSGVRVRVSLGYH